jgi:aminoglycoside phosphotransferase (APT) family kinase protein
VIAQCDYLSSNWEQFASLCEEMPKTLVHGDFIPKNVGVRSTQAGITLLPFDWEKAGWGSPAEDISRVDIPTYWDTVQDYWPESGIQAFNRLANIGEVFRCLVYIDWIAPQLGDKVVEKPLHHLRLCETWLADLIKTSPWRD